MDSLTDLVAIEKREAAEIVDRALRDATLGRACLTCSFQAEDVAVLDLLRHRVPQIPVLFLETGYHFPETYEFRDRLARQWNLNLINVLPRQTVAEQESQLGVLYREEAPRCCQLRKVEPLMAALDPYDVWFTGLRREQSPTRKNLQKIESHRLPSGKTLLKVSPLADWTWGRLWEHTSARHLPYLPLYDRGFTSIGCQPCTTLPSDPNNPRSGRWAGNKLECGIHTFSQQSTAAEPPQ